MNINTLLVPLFFLGNPGLFLAYVLASRRLAGTAWRGGRRSMWIAAAMFPAYAFAIAYFRPDLPLGRHRDVTSIVLLGFIVPSCVVGWLLWRHTRRRLPSAAVIAASLPSAAAFFVFESGTHGRWYIQNEGTVIALSLLVASTMWHLMAGAGVLGWAWRSRRERAGQGCCSACGYSLAGLSSGTVKCPECGGAISADSTAGA